MQKKYVIKIVPMDQIHMNPAEPDGRMGSSGAMNTLKTSIQRHGLLYPPLVVPRNEGDGYTLVDGHRRFTACGPKYLNQTEIPVMVTEGVPDVLFSNVCQTTKGVTSFQWLDIHLKGGTVPPGATKDNIKALERTCGREFLETMRTNKVSPSLWKVGKKVLKYCELDETELVAVLTWILAHKQSRPIGAFIAGEGDKAFLVNCFRADIPIDRPITP